MNKTLNEFFYNDKNSDLGFIRLIFGILGSLVLGYLTIMYRAKF